MISTTSCARALTLFLMVSFSPILGAEAQSRTAGMVIQLGGCLLEQGTKPAKMAGETSQLHWQSSGVADKFGGITTCVLRLGDAVPEGLKSSPKAVLAPKYGVLGFNQGGTTIPVTIIVDGPKGSPGTLFVNRNADGEMISEAAHPMELKTGKYADGSMWTRYSTDVLLNIPFAGKSRAAHVKFLRLDPKTRADRYDSFLTVASDFGYAGTAAINSKPIRTTVLCNACLDMVDLTAGKRSNMRFWFDLNGDGKRDPGEVVELGESFLFDGRWWAVASLANDGTIRIISPDHPVREDEKKSFTAQQARCLEAYLAAHPNSRDFNVGLGQLFMHYRDEEANKQKAEHILDRQYSYLISRASAQALKDGLRFQFLASVGMDAHARALVAIQREHDFLIRESYRDYGALAQNLEDWVFQLTRFNQPKSIARADQLVSQAKAEFASDPDAQRVSALFERCNGLCHRPVVGGTLKLASTALDGTRVDLQAMSGKVVLIDFWATWCVPCVESQPGLKAAYDRFHAKGFEVIGISLDEANSKEKVAAFVQEKGLPWPQLYDGKGWSTPLAVSCGIVAIPATYLIGKDGKIDRINVGGKELEARLAELLK